jgi:AbrB family looped-hinge helix DNA binding protein
MMKQTVVSVRGQTVIPQEIREQLGIKPKTKLAWSAQGGMITVIPIPEDPIEASFGMLAGRGYTLKDFLEERRRERELERKQDEHDDALIRRAKRKRRTKR